MPFNEASNTFAPRGSGMGASLPGAPGGTVERAGGSIMFNPNTVATQGAGDQASVFLQALFQNPAMFMQGLSAMASPLQQQAVGNMGAFLNQPAPETRALGQAMPAIQGLLGGQPMQNPFGESPFGGFSAGQQVVNAAQPVFNQNLQQAMTQVANRAPSVRNAAFGDEASGLAQRALGDFNLFQQQALQQGQGLDLQHQQLGQQFALGAGSLAQQGQLGGLGALGALSQAAGNNPFQRMLGAGQLGNQITQSNINPLIQLMLGGMDFGRQSPLELAIPQQGGGGGFMGALGGLLGAGLGSFTGGIGSGLAEGLFS